MKIFTMSLISVAYITALVQTSATVALPRTIALRNATDTMQRVWVRSNYTVKQGLLERCEADLIIREILPRDSLVYGDRYHTFDFIEIKLNPMVSANNLTTPVGGTTVSGLGGIKSIVTITSAAGYELDNKGTTDPNKQLKEATDQMQKASQEAATQARAKAQTAQEIIGTKAEQAAQAAKQSAAKVQDKAARVRDDVSQKAKAVGDTMRKKTYETATKVREKAHDAKEAVANGLTRAQNTIREKTHQAADTIREKAQDTKEALANSVARSQNRAEEAKIAASGRWATMKASMYNWWCSVKIKLSRFFRR
jgi:hypothetical protein